MEISITKEQADQISQLITATKQLQLLEDLQRERGYNPERAKLINEKRDKIADLAILLDDLGVDLAHRVIKIQRCPCF
jgi:hypothetical protein